MTHPRSIKLSAPTFSHACKHAAEPLVGEMRLALKDALAERGLTALNGAFLQASKTPRPPTSGSWIVVATANGSGSQNAFAFLTTWVVKNLHLHKGKVDHQIHGLLNRPTIRFGPSAHTSD